ncbi:hypothetical protein FQR65_LT09408 [Abscondita terminalis]|nr:hypothetical protein FQR65_LT09408 [Abscondita terminalis]
MVLSMEKWKGKLAVVTGASYGIGAAVVNALLDEGVVVAGLARTADKVKELSTSTSLHAIKVNLKNEDEIINAFEWITTNLGPISILVNCAGIGRLTNIVNGDSQMWRDTMDVNFMAVCLTVRETVKNMKANNIDGHIVNINSIGGHKIIYYERCNVQPCSKFALTALAEILRQELNAMKTKIKISDVSPGFVSTNIFKAMVYESGGTDEAYESLKNRLDSYPALEAKDIASAVLYVLSTPPHCQVHELIIKPVGERL